MPTTALAIVALMLMAQVPKEPAKDLFLHSAQVPGVEVRFVDYHWQPVLFGAMESGKGDIPEAKRNWVYARLILDDRPLKLEGRLLPVGTYAVTLWPNLTGKGMEVEMRRVDMRDVFPNVNAIAPAPRGETIYKGPATFETVSPLVERLAVDLADASGVVVMALRYGDRRLALKLAR